MWRARRQFAVLLIFAFIAGVILATNFRKIIPAPTCFDSKKNQGEGEADCGGPCKSCELKHPKDIISYWARYVQVRDDSYDVAAFIENPNQNLFSERLEYEFTLFDSLGIIAHRAGRTFIYPQEKVYLVEANLNTTREPTHAEFKIKGVEWGFQDTVWPNFATEKKEYKTLEFDGKKQSVVEIELANKLPFGFREAEVTVLLLDKKENILGTQRTVIDDFLSRSSRSVRLTWPEEIKGAVANTIIEPRVNIFKSGAVLKPQ